MDQAYQQNQRPHQQPGRRNRPRQLRNAQPVEEVEHQPPPPRNQRPPPNNNNNQNRRRGLAASVGDPIPRGNPDAFKPKHVSTSGTLEKDDPLILDSVLVDGLSGAVPCERDRKFQLDFSQYIQIIRSSYYVMSRLDRGLAKYVSYSTFQYYCIVLLWKRIRFVMTERGSRVGEYETLKRRLPPMAIPDEIGYYLDGIGNITDYNARKYNLALQGILRLTQVHGISGHYGRVDEINHYQYETLPAPFVFVFRMLQDLAFTSARNRHPAIDFPREWNLPIDLRPEGNIFPNRNLLGWDYAERLTVEQVSMLENAGLSVDFNDDGAPVFDTTGIDNFDGIPILYNVLLQTSEFLSGPKSSFNNHVEATSFRGSLAQVGFALRAFRTPQVEYPQPVSMSEATAHFYTQVSVHICGAASTFRYRVKRVVHGLHDSLCYLGPRGGAPPGWGDNADFVFTQAEDWNSEEFRTVMVSGIVTSDRYVERIRKIAPRDQV